MGGARPARRVAGRRRDLPRREERPPVYPPHHARAGGAHGQGPPGRGAHPRPRRAPSAAGSGPRRRPGGDQDGRAERLGAAREPRPAVARRRGPRRRHHGGVAGGVGLPLCLRPAPARRGVQPVRHDAAWGAHPPPARRARDREPIARRVPRHHASRLDRRRRGRHQAEPRGGRARRPRDRGAGRRGRGGQRERPRRIERRPASRSLRISLPKALRAEGAEVREPDYETDMLAALDRRGYDPTPFAPSLPVNLRAATSQLQRISLAAEGERSASRKKPWRPPSGRSASIPPARPAS